MSPLQGIVGGDQLAAILFCCCTRGMGTHSTCTAKVRGGFPSRVHDSLKEADELSGLMHGTDNGEDSLSDSVNQRESFSIADTPTCLTQAGDSPAMESRLTI